MTFDPSSEEPPSIKPSTHSQLQALWHRFTVRFVLLLGIVVFLTAVGFDSLQQASAADLPTERLGLAATAPRLALVSRSARSNAQRSQKPQKSYLSFDAATANRLSHSDLTSASMTRSRLTSSHLLTGYAR
jgi:hypothetical protein